jgi:putative FmdB family regulatory protein
MVTASAVIRPDHILRRLPIYEYRCEDGHLFEVMQKITDDPVTTCGECGAAVQRVYHPIAVHFKGSGFYNTDYGTSKRKREMEKSASDGADKHDAKTKEKRESKTSDSSSSSSSSAKKTD